jgi:hypothetical protein
MTTSSLLTTGALLVLFVSLPASAQELPLCEKQKVVYGVFDKAFSDRMKIQPGPVGALIVGEKQFSPQKTRWFFQSRPDYVKNDPWTTLIWVRDSAGGEPEMLTFVDHTSGGVNVQWLNEKLLYGSVEWERNVTTDFVFDFEKREFIYREMANYRQLTEACQ